MICFCSCGTRNDNSTGRNAVADGASMANGTISQSKIFVKDRSHYSQIFIDQLSTYSEPVSLVDEYVVTGTDTTYFPKDLALKSWMLFKAAKGDLVYLIDVSRLNLTDLDYRFRVIDKDGATVFTKMGRAVLAATFFLAAEMDEDIEMDESYGSNEYWDKTDECAFSIRVGIGRDDKGRNRLSLTYSCLENNTHAFDLGEIPILRTE